MAIRFFEKNKIDLSKGSLVTITVDDGVASNPGQEFVDLMRNRQNDNGWATTGSSDAGNTELIVEFGESHNIDCIFFVGMNWKAYTAQYWNGAAWTNFGTPIAETVNASAVKLHEFAAVDTEKIRIVITGTFVADADKVCAQIVVTQAIGSFVTQPYLERPTPSRNKKFLKALSGKGVVLRSTGGFSVRMRQDAVGEEADLALIERLNEFYEGFLLWICGGDESQFRPGVRIGYRLEDLFLVNVVNEYSPEFHRGLYRNGVDVDLIFAEVI